MELTAIGRWLSSYTGISPQIIGEQSLTRAVSRRLEATGSVDPEMYLPLLLSSEAEQDALVELLVVPETWFFRDRHPFNYLKRHISNQLTQRQEQGHSEPLRLLSAPCSSGEEPYSMAMTLLGMGLPASGFRIDAIDICKPSIRKARRAVYSQHSFRGVTADERQLHFETTAEGFRLHPRIAETVHFQRSNLMGCLETVSIPYDVVFCRNLLIYLEDGASAYLLETIGTWLKPGGLLVVGSAEMGRVPTAIYEPLRESFVFGFERRGPGFPRAPQEPPPREVRSSVAQASDRKRGAERSGGHMRVPLAQRPQRRPGSNPDSQTRTRPTMLESSPALELEQCRRSLECDPSCEATYMRMADLLLQSQRKQEAIGCLQKYLYLQPRSAEALHKLVVLSRELGQEDQSRLYAARLARLAP